MFGVQKVLKKQTWYVFLHFSTVNKIHNILWMLASWSGPISVAVYTPQQDVYIIGAVLNLFDKCLPELKSRVRFHMMHPIGNQTQTEDETQIYINKIRDIKCSHSYQELFNNLENIFSEPRTYEQLPQNHLRNLAQLSCNSDYKLVVDIDMIPVPNMFERLSTLLVNSAISNKCALVVPIYEVENPEFVLPATKSSLIKMVKSEKARIYHKKVI